jgi:hypothetical protein
MFPKRLRQEPRILALTLVITFISVRNTLFILFFSFFSFLIDIPLTMNYSRAPISSVYLCSGLRKPCKYHDSIACRIMLTVQ